MEGNYDLKIDFSFTDEFDQESRVVKNFKTYGDRTQSEFLVEKFKLFLLACGHSVETVDKIQIVEE
jgi:hypothetical protein